MKFPIKIKLLLVIPIALLFIVSSTYGQTKPTDTGSAVYKCMPCGYGCDTLTFSAAGTCMHCKMALVKASAITHKTIAPSAICGYIQQNPSVILLDVRTVEEFEGTSTPDFGTLKNAINVPIKELESRLESLAHLKEKEIIVFCSHSHRSPLASFILTSNGFTKVTNMAKGGMSVMNDKKCKEK